MFGGNGIDTFDSRKNIQRFTTGAYSQVFLFHIAAGFQYETCNHLRIFSIASALEEGYSIERIHELTKIDPWFLGKLKNIVDYKAKLSTYNKIEDLPEEVLRQAKVLGFSDFQIARFVLKASGNQKRWRRCVGLSG